MKVLFTVYIALMLTMSAVAFIYYKRDKAFAKKGAYRTPEKTLLLLAACLGGLGAFAGMKVFRHKTQHLRFQIIVPLCMIVQLIVLCLLTYLAFIR